MTGTKRKGAVGRTGTTQAAVAKAREDAAPGVEGVPATVAPAGTVPVDQALVASLPEEWPVPEDRRLVAPTGHHLSGGTWDRRVAAEVLTRVASGETLSAVSTLPGMPRRTTWAGWCLSVPQLRQLWLEAQFIRASAAFDEAIDTARAIARQRGISSEQVSAARLLVETLKWAAGKLSPKEYGDKADNMPVVNIKIVTDLDLGFDAEHPGPKVPGPRQGEIIDISANDVTYSIKAPIQDPSLAAARGDAAAEAGDEDGRPPAPRLTLRGGPRAGSALKDGRKRRVLDKAFKRLAEADTALGAPSGDGPRGDDGGGPSNGLSNGDDGGGDVETDT